jgi:hypothetical protein
MARSKVVWGLVIATMAAAAAFGEESQYRPPRTPHGHPDLQGVWTNATWTPFQRPSDFKGPTATEAEAAAYIAKREAILRGETALPPSPLSPHTPDVGGLESEWYEPRTFLRIDGAIRTSVMVDPPDGRLPFSEAGKARAKAVETADEIDFSGPEVRAPDERCLQGVGGVAGPPMLPAGYNSHYEIIQTADEVAILVEMIHDLRIIRLNASQPSVRVERWMGNSTGRWEGDELVVETVDQRGGAYRFLPSGPFFISEKGTVTERFRRISPTEILYRFEVNDPVHYDRPWRGELLLVASSATIYEYACHEGNYSLPNILRGARVQERESAGAAR